MSEKSMDAVGPGVYPPLLFGLVLLTIILQKVFRVASPVPRATRNIGFPLFISGLLLGGSAIKAQAQAGTPVDPHLPTKSLVKTGPYSFTRNPIYLSFSLILSGLAFLFNAVWSLPLIPGMLAVLDRGMVKPEEEYLERKFGSEYKEYRQKVRRWI